MSTETLIVTLDDLLDFVRSKCITERVSFCENGADNPCGCIMVQYGKYIGLDFTMCSTDSWLNRIQQIRVAKLDHEIKSDYRAFGHVHTMDDDVVMAENYGEVRIAIRQRFGIDL